MSDNCAAMDTASTLSNNSTCQDRKSNKISKSSIIFSILLVAVGFIQYNEYVNVCILVLVGVGIPFWVKGMHRF